VDTHTVHGQHHNCQHTGIKRIISAAGNVSGNYILGNGSQLTGISINPSNIASGTSNVKIVSAGGNATVNIGGTANVAVFATTGEYITGC
jgi:hypothetical protein